MGERIVFRKNDRLHTVNPRWRGNPTAGGRFFNRQHRWKPGVGSVLKWRFSESPAEGEKNDQMESAGAFPAFAGSCGRKFTDLAGT